MMNRKLDKHFDSADDLLLWLRRHAAKKARSASIPRAVKALAETVLDPNSHDYGHTILSPHHYSRALKSELVVCTKAESKIFLMVAERICNSSKHFTSVTGCYALGNLLGTVTWDEGDEPDTASMIFVSRKGHVACASITDDDVASLVRLIDDAERLGVKFTF